MKVSQAIECLKTRKPDEEIVMAWFTREDFEYLIKIKPFIFEISDKDWAKVTNEVMHSHVIDDFTCNVHDEIDDILKELLEDD